jgi:hypothetical protein
MVRINVLDPLRYFTGRYRCLFERDCGVLYVMVVDVGNRASVSGFGRTNPNAAIPLWHCASCIIRAKVIPTKSQTNLLLGP